MKITAIRKKMRKSADPEKARILRRFFKTGPGEYGEGDVFLGITIPQTRELAREYADISEKDLLRLLRSRIHEERLLALLILVGRYKTADIAGKARVYGFYLAHIRSVNNWDLVDLSAQHIVGAHLEKRDRTLLFALAKSGNLWKRRIAMVSTFHFIRNRDFSSTLRIAGMLLGDREDLLHKATGWMLREIGKREMPVLEEFIEKHVTRMPRTMLRYAIERMPEEKRRSYLLKKSPPKHARN